MPNMPPGASMNQPFNPMQQGQPPQSQNLNPMTQQQ